MTLKELGQKIKTVNFQGMAPLRTEELVIYQGMAFDWIMKLCEPLNLLVPYQDNNIYRSVGDGWFLKKPTIAKGDDEFIDIDERLEMAFVYIVVYFLGTNRTGLEKRGEAYRLILEYSIDVEQMGYSKAKEVYEKESFITAVRFDCYGKFYEVSPSFMDTIITCTRCGNECMNSAEQRQIEMYREYLNGSVKPLDREKMIALDNALFTYLMNDIEKISSYTSDELESLTTRFNELCKLEEGEAVTADVVALNKRMANPVCCEEEKTKVCVDER